MWVPLRSTGARRGSCLGYAACLAPLACLPRRGFTPRGASLFFFLVRLCSTAASFLPKPLSPLSLPFPTAPPSPLLTLLFSLRRRLRRRRCALAPLLAAGHSGSSLLHAAEIQPVVVLQVRPLLDLILSMVEVAAYSTRPQSSHHLRHNTTH
jgi:hypothetical protein